MKIKRMLNPREGILLIEKNEKAQLKHDIVISEGVDDKKLVVGTVLSEGSTKFPKGTQVVFGRYSLFHLTYQEENFFFCEEEDIVATIN